MPAPKKPQTKAAAKKPRARKPLDLATLEALLAALRPEVDPDQTPVDAAQNVMYDAWEAPTTAKRVALARKALEISPHCADAYVLLAQEDAKSLEQARDLYDQGVKAGEQALGADGFKEYRGRFWGYLETRPYMRARAGLAATLAQLGDLKGAVAHYKEMLKLNPNDNQGIRYLLAAALMKQGDVKALKALFKKYSEDAGAEWLYGRALMAFREGGETEEANALAAEALQSNAYVPAALSGKAKPKRRTDGLITVGGADEAAYYVEGWGEAWRGVQGAVDWLVCRAQ